MIKNLLLIIAGLIVLTACSATPNTKNVETYFASARMASPMQSDIARKEAPASRMIAYSANVYMSVMDRSATRANLTEVIKELSGMILVEKDHYIYARLPVENYTEFVERLNNTEGDVSIEITGEDVTDYYDDVLLTLESKKQLKKRYLALLDKAKDVSDLLAIEKELERIDLEIKRLESSKLNTEKRVEYTTVTIKITEKETKVLGPVGWAFSKSYAAIRRLFIWRD